MKHLKISKMSKPEGLNPEDARHNQLMQFMSSFRSSMEEQLKSTNTKIEEEIRSTNHKIEEQIKTTNDMIAKSTRMSKEQKTLGKEWMTD